AWRRRRVAAVTPRPRALAWRSRGAQQPASAGAPPSCSALRAALAGTRSGHSRLLLGLRPLGRRGAGRAVLARAVRPAGAVLVVPVTARLTDHASRPASSSSARLARAAAAADTSR